MPYAVATSSILYQRIVTVAVHCHPSFATSRSGWYGIGLIAAGLLLPIAAAQAKCASIAYELDGRVVAADGTAVAGATVSTSWKDYFGPRTERTTTADDGRFHQSLRINGYIGGGWLTGDRCGRFTKTVNVTIESAGHAMASRDLELTAPALQADFVLR